ncbi:helix-turn-helix domain-containing protein [Pleionea sediminis]|uniref:helix-turn-helix domain-containing protein n=1 Tax=Pleionea sediminis TaxID=2569479 RepID=UPI00118520CE|nr:helix-turn-helix transcriptional regulator [Pleionea sediminis]
MHPGSRVRIARNQLKMKQSELAEKTGLSQKAISKIETGVTQRFDTSVFADVLNVSNDWILTGENSPDWLKVKSLHGLSDKDLASISMAFQLAIDAGVTSNPNIDDKVKIELFRHISPLDLARMALYAYKEGAKDKEDVFKILKMGL